MYIRHKLIYIFIFTLLSITGAYSYADDALKGDRQLAIGITGDTSVCTFEESMYQAGRNDCVSYTWYLDGGKISFGDSTAMLSVYWETTGQKDIMLVALINDTTLYSDTSYYQVNIYEKPDADINGSRDVCANSTNIYQTVKNKDETLSWLVIGSKSYQEIDESSISVDWGASGTGRIILVIENINNCSDTAEIAVNIGDSLRPEITGNETACLNDTAFYKTDADSALSNKWTVQGGLLVSSDDEDEIMVIWNRTGGGQVILEQSSAGGCEGSNFMNVKVYDKPDAVINGNRTVCRNSYETYIGNNSPSVTNKWKAENGTIFGTDTSQTVEVEWTGSSPAYLTLYTQISGSDCIDSITIDIAINDPPFVGLSGELIVCEGQEYIYVSDNSGPAYSNQWFVDSGHINGVSDADSAYISWDRPGTGTITLVTGDENSNCSDSLVFIVEVYPLPAPDFDADTIACEGEYKQYLALDTAGVLNLWTVSGGTIVGNNSSGLVEILWGQTGKASVTLRQYYDSLDCFNEITKELYVHPFTPLRIIGDTVVCTNSAHTFYSGADAVYTVEWFADGGTIMNSDNYHAEIRWDQGGPESIQMVYYIPDTQCNDTSYLDINVIDFPEPNIYGNDIAVPSGTETYSSDYADDIIYKWTVSGGEISGPDNEYEVRVVWNNAIEGLLTLCISNDYGCESCTDKTVSISSVNTRVKLAYVHGEPGDVVNIPVYLMNGASLIDAGAEELSANIIFNSTLLVPVDDTPMGYLDGDNRKVPISLSINELNNILDTLTFMVTYGNSDTTSLVVDSLCIAGTEYYLKAENGFFRLDGICHDGGYPKLINPNTKAGIRNISPNPAKESILIEYSISEKCDTYFVIYNYMGQIVRDIHLISGETGDGSLSIDLNELSDGKYLIFMKTETINQAKTFSIMK